MDYKEVVVYGYHLTLIKIKKLNLYVNNFNKKIITIFDLSFKTWSSGISYKTNGIDSELHFKIFKEEERREILI